MNSAVVAGALVVAGLNAVSCLLGAAVWYYGVKGRAFWLLLRISQGAAVVYAAGVGVLAAAGRNSSDHLFYLYALLPLAVAFVAEQLRLTSAQAVLDQRGLDDAQAVAGLSEDEQRRLVGAIVRREAGVMALSAMVVVFLAARAAGTAHGF